MPPKRPFTVYVVSELGCRILATVDSAVKEKDRRPIDESQLT